MCAASRDEGERGVCGADSTVVVARAALHYWEEPPLSGERGSGAVFFSHCPLHCVYCQNALIANGSYGKSVSVRRLATIFLELQQQRALNINCVTPTHYALAIARAIELSREQGLNLPIVWNTSGYERVEMVRALSKTVDVYLTDFKYASSQIAQAYSHAPDYSDVALKALDAMVSEVGPAQFDEVDGEPRMTRGVIVRHLLLPGHLDDSKRVLELLHHRYGSAIMVSVMNQYTPLLAASAEEGNEHAQSVLRRYPQLAQTVSDEAYERLLDYADAIGMEDYFWQEGPAALESFVPAWDGTGV